MNVLARLPIASCDPIASRMVIAGCSARKVTTDRAVAALELYEGGCIPPLRARLGVDRRLRARVRILSAEHGLITADTRLWRYDRTLDPERAAQLRPAVTRALAKEGKVPEEVLVIVEPLYLVLLIDLLATATRVHWIPEVRHGWGQATAVLNAWGWP